MEPVHFMGVSFWESHFGDLKLLEEDLLEFQKWQAAKRAAGSKFRFFGKNRQNEKWHPPL